MPVRQPLVEQTQGQEAMTKRLQRTFDGMRQDIGNLTASDITFAAVAADWVSPVPTTLQDALNRIAKNNPWTHPVPL